MSLKLPREQKEQLIDDVQAYFELERGEPIGRLAAEQMIDFMIVTLGPYIYNHAMADARKAVMERLAVLEDELYSLDKPITGKRQT